VKGNHVVSSRIDLLLSARAAEAAKFATSMKSGTLS